MSNALKQAATIVDGYKITTPAELAGATSDSLSDVNNQGVVVGSYTNATGSTLGAIGQPGGTLVTFDAPDGADGVPAGINNTGTVVGLSALGGFIDQGGTITILTEIQHLGGPNPAIFQTMPHGINDHGEVVGSFWEEGDTELSFIYSHGTMEPGFRAPGAQIATVANAVNNKGVIAGFYENSKGLHGFVRATDGTFTTLDVSTTPDVNGEIYTVINGIDARGDLVGTYEDSSDKRHGFIDQGGTITTFDMPGAANTTLTGISENGSRLSGTYYDANGTSHGFTATLAGHNVS